MSEDIAEKYSKEWIDFVIYPGKPKKANSMQKRIDTSNAFRINEEGSYPSEYEPMGDIGAVIEQSAVEFDGSQFLAMYFYRYGDVTVWTTKMIWVIRESPPGLERFQGITLNHEEIEDIKVL